jgi:hypothetical protein
MKRPDSKGFVDLALALSVLVLAAAASYASSLSARHQIIDRSRLLNDTDGFYASEMAVISAVVNNQAAPLPNGRTVIRTFKNSP